MDRIKREIDYDRIMDNFIKFVINRNKVVPVWEFPKMTSREFPGISRFSGKTRAGNGKKHIEIFAPKLQRHF